MGLVVEPLGSGVVLFAPQGGACFELDEVAAFAWKLLDGRRTLGQVIDAVAEEFSVSHAAASADLLRLAAAIVQEGLATVTSGAAVAQP